MWTDEQALADFGEIIGPAMQKAGLEAKPPVLINGPNGGWVATLRPRQAGNSQAAN